MNGPPADFDSRVRHAAFAFLREQCRIHGDDLPWRILSRGFEFEGARVPLVSQQGIFKPRILDLPLSIRTTFSGDGPAPYEDEEGPDGLVSYCYRGTNPAFHENQRLRETFRRHVPLVYLRGVDQGLYTPFFPAFLVADQPEALRFTIAIDDEMFAFASMQAAPDATSVDRRRYVTAQQRVRLHQRDFSSRVIRAYRVRCAVCSLRRHRELLDGAHILRDGHPRGLPVVQNGIAMCKIHHAAFDGNLLGIRPDAVVVIRADVLREEDGPMLLHGLKGFHERPLVLPRNVADHPDRDRLEERFDEFRRTG